MLRKLFLLVIVVLVSGLFLGHSNAGGDTKSYHIPNYIVGITVQPNGSLNIVENISYSFDQGVFTYAYRDIPWKGYDDILNVTVTDTGLGLSVPFTFVFTGGNYHIQWNFQQAISPVVKTFSIQYLVTNALGQPGADLNRLQWQALGSDWKVPISKLSTFVVLPISVNSSQLAISPQMAGFLQTPTTTKIAFAVTGLPTQTSYSVIIDLPKITNVSYSPLRVMRDSPITIAALSFLAVFGVMFGFWAWKGRGPKLEHYPGDSVTSPPSALPPEEVGFLVRNNVDTHVVLATILGLAKKGFLDLYDSAGTPFRVNEPPPMTLTDKGNEAIKNRSDGSDVTYAERVILESVEMVEDDPLRRYEAAFAMRKLGQRVGDALFRKGFYSVDPRRVRKDFSVLAVAIVAAGFLLFIIASNQMSLYSFSGLLIGFALGSIPVGIIGHKVRRLTMMGAEERGKWISFLHYLHERVDVLKLSNPKDAVGVFDESIMYLPLIPGLRLSHWMNDLSRHFRGVLYSPVWYHSYYAGRGGSAGGANVAGVIVNDFGTFAQSIGNSIGFYNSWIGSIGGSGGGGGGAGGGGGGGGGGGAG